MTVSSAPWFLTKPALPPSTDDGHNKQTADLKPPARQYTNDARAISQVSNTNRREYSRQPSLVRAEYAKYAQDDNIIREEDIWSSWKHIVSEKKRYGNSARLQNASWRAWTKSKYLLTTVSAKTLNWLKDSDVTWLYGPLQTYSDRSSTSHTAVAGIGISKLDPLLNKKPILKRRSALEIMLQLSLYTSTSLNPLVSRQNRGNEFLPVTPSREEPSAANAKRQIHFRDKVEQFVVVDIEDDGDESIGGVYAAADDNSLNDGLLTMKELPKWNALNQYNRNDSQISSSAKRRAIAILPSTTLGCQEDVPELVEVTTEQGSDWLYLALSQGTLQSLEPTTETLLGGHDEGEDKGDNVVVPGLFS
ncbi:hypothetical protein B0J14DRAFT_653374 [Halenospora varia]|nr:hypothetical protein B0J14DRAFT_653374 [Halenospora varia]